MLTHWKEREPVYRARRARIMAEHDGVVPAYAVSTAGGAPVDVEPEEAPAVARRRLTTPDEPSELTDEEFEALRRDLEIDGHADAAVVPPPRARTATATPPPAPTQPGDVRRAPDEAENEGIVKDSRKSGSNRRNRRHGRSR